MHASNVEIIVRILIIKVISVVWGVVDDAALGRHIRQRHCRALLLLRLGQPEIECEVVTRVC